jgi:SAM-dependent methyltransferase
MSTESFGRDFWEHRWAQVLRDHADVIAARPPNAYVTSELDGLTPGRALDAGCGHGAESIWLAARGWQVTGVDFSTTALGIARATAASLGHDVGGRIEWVEGDLGSWAPPGQVYDLVVSLYVHVEGSVPDLVRRLAGGVAPGGTLFLVGHLPVDPATGQPTPAAGQVQVTVPDAVAALDPGDWDVAAEERRRAAEGTGVDAVVRAVRRRQ